MFTGFPGTPLLGISVNRGPALFLPALARFLVVAAFLKRGISVVCHKR